MWHMTQAGFVIFLTKKDEWLTLLEEVLKGKSIIITNPDTFSISDTLPYLDQKRIHFTSFAIDPDKYSPANSNGVRTKFINEDGILLISLSRQMWNEKGNDKMIKALAKFIKVFPNSMLILVEWSIDTNKSKEHVNSLHIQKKFIG